MYTDDRNAQIVLALLKKYNIRKIVVSPGTKNVPIAMSVQRDPFFEVYSVVDERSAAYFATGLVFESGEPVVISCTGSTASRNYLSALTEAYYRGLPVIALTSQHYFNDYDNFAPQTINRTFSQHDVKRISVNLPIIKNFEDEATCILSANKALTMATKRGCGPVHINLINESFTFNTPNLPDVTKIDYYQTETLLCDDYISQLKNQLYGKKIGLLIGAHRRFSKKEINTIEAFLDTYDAVVFYDIASSYHGKNKVLLSVASGLRKIDIKPDIVIDIGSVTPVYSASNLLQGVEFWRISEDGEFHQRFSGNLKKQFDCCEYIFFDMLTDKQNKPIESKYYHTILESMGKVIVPELPFSNIFVSSQFAQKLPENCSFHAGASESLSNMNFFALKESIYSGANVGMLGIDGSISTLVGQSMVYKNKLYFGLVGDLTFFYDMNILGNRHIQKNIRLMLVNNGLGVRFRVTPFIEEIFGDETDAFIAACGHNGSAEGWARSMGFEYMTAKNKKEFLKRIDKFCSPDINKFDKPVLFEVFTTVRDEQDAFLLFRDANK
jgi:2-succinyl-5-enolpyruvyl-6-hydroxy-3-cyclohexene-1-carboxylate synthase